MTTTPCLNGLRRSPLRLLASLAVCLSALLSQTANAQCTRQDLSRLVDNFLAALSAKDPARLTVASNLKFTENGRIMNLGEGLWKTAGEITFSRSAIDVEQCGTLTQAVMNEDGVDVPTIYGVRLRVNDKAELTDIETYIARSTEFAHNPEGVPVEDGEDWEALLEPSALLRRQEAEENYTDRLATLEECRALPWGAVWDYYCATAGLPPRGAWLTDIRRYERDVLSGRG